MAAAICCFASVTHHAGATSQTGATSSTFESLTSSDGSSPFSIASAPGNEDPPHHYSALPATNEPLPHRRISPPKTFVCFVCGRPYNERDYQRHIEGFVKKAEKAMTGVFKTKKGTCPGIMHMNHPILKRFPGTYLDQRVRNMCADISSLCHGGALDALSAEGSGRHINVNARVQWLMSDDPN
jgi:hypothetical protein